MRALLVVLALVALPAFADHKPLQTFQLNESLAETVIGCNVASAAVEITQSLVAQDQRGAMAIAQGYAEQRVCWRLTTMITYRSRVFAKHGADGLWTVYAADVFDGSRWFVILLNFTHERAS